jgi:hypothetical protein
MCSGSAFAKGGGSSVDNDSGLEVSASMGFLDVDDSTSLDWGADSGSPELRAKAWSTSLFRLVALPWLELGPCVRAELGLDSGLSSLESGEPALAAEDFDVGLTAGPLARASCGFGELKIRGSLAALGGASILDLDDADSDYLPTGASASDFWFRLEPCLGYDAELSLRWRESSLSLGNRYLATWDSGDAYDRDWTLGFIEKAKLKARYELPSLGAIGLDANLTLDYSLESRLIVPVEKLEASLRLDAGLEGVGTIRISPLLWTGRADLPDLDPSAREDVEDQLSCRLEWEAPIKSGAWSAYIVLPYLATEDGEACPGTWELGLIARIGG